VEASAGTNNVSGLLVRTQNCSIAVGQACVHCSGSGSKASVVTFAPLLSGGGASGTPKFGPLSQVYGPGNGTFDDFGTEDPRLKYDPTTGLYYLFYTSYGR
jgi:hypothetical protein